MVAAARLPVSARQPWDRLQPVGQPRSRAQVWSPVVLGTTGPAVGSDRRRVAPSSDRADPHPVSAGPRVGWVRQSPTRRPRLLVAEDGAVRQVAVALVAQAVPVSGAAVVAEVARIAGKLVIPAVPLVSASSVKSGVMAVLPVTSVVGVVGVGGQPVAADAAVVVAVVGEPDG